MRKPTASCARPRPSFSGRTAKLCRLTHRRFCQEWVASLARGFVMRRAAILAVALFFSPPAVAQDEGIRPVGTEGRALNLDFETGTLRDWNAEGTAFAGQPVKGDTVAARRADMKSQHQGQYWIGTYERDGDKPEGTLTSV